MKDLREYVYGISADDYTNLYYYIPSSGRNFALFMITYAREAVNYKKGKVQGIVLFGRNDIYR